MDLVYVHDFMHVVTCFISIVYDRTGALHVGDRILAINTTSLQGRPLSDAIDMLQNAGDVVTLKITRLAQNRQSNAPRVYFMCSLSTAKRMTLV